MRGAVEGLEAPHPLGWVLPGLYHEDDFMQRFTSSLDDMLAPVLLTLDTIDAYFDPLLAPADFVAWLGGWVGFEIDENWPTEVSRRLVAAAVELLGWRGTLHGLQHMIQIYAGADSEVHDSGGATWSAAPGGQLPGSPRGQVTVRVPSRIDRARVERVVAASAPAEVQIRVEGSGA